MKSRNEGVLSWLLSQIALLIAVGILIASVASITLFNNWKTIAESRMIANSLTSEIMWMDLMEYNASERYFMPPGNYEAYISPEYVTIVNKKMTVRKHLIAKPFIGESWHNGKELHKFLHEKYGYSGKSSEPLPYNEYENVKKYLDGEYANISRKRTIYPLKIDIHKPILIEKDFIYFDAGTNFKRIGLVIISQEET